jgi:hypothetical protein
METLENASMDEANGKKVVKKVKVAETNRGRTLPLRSPYNETDSGRKLKFENPDPNFHYHWTAKDDPNRIGHFEKFADYGYEPVQIGGREKYYGRTAKSGENYISVPMGAGEGAMVLCKMPLEFKKYHDAQQRKMNDELLNAKASGVIAGESLTETGGVRISYSA